LAIQTLTARMWIGGPFWTTKGWPDVFITETLELDAQREYIVLTPFTAPDRRSVFDIDGQQVTIETTAGALIDRRADVRASFAGFDRTTPWDVFQVGYFASYALWNYLTEPFLFTYPGFRAWEIEPWPEEGQIWRRLHVTFPDTIATHDREQVFYDDSAFMQRRMDYAPEVNGNSPTAHYTGEPKTFGGLVFPTRRRIYPRNSDGTADQSVATITIDIHDVAVSSPAAKLDRQHAV
jgi:hypothetical protein